MDELSRRDILFPYKEKDICAAGYIKIIDDNFYYPDAHILIFNHHMDDCFKIAYCLDFGLAVNSDTIKNAFSKMRSELKIFFDEKYSDSKLHKNIDLYSIQASSYLWDLFRKHYQPYKNDLFFSQDKSKYKIKYNFISYDFKINKNENF